ncbi:MAG TPA: ATP-binding cassette domain-containing protein [Candidatus Dormibacteraeota bacterium]|nr:ATP-binding cassette domain-containing protein [Candidatus Dormibacteraeota bacterium]
MANESAARARVRTVIAASDLAARYGNRTIWSGCDLSISRGSFVAVLGPNGAGKSTLFRLLLGELPPAEGRLAVFGSPVRAGDPRIGYIPQTSAFDPEFSIRGLDFVGLGIDGFRWGVRLSGRASKRRIVDDAVRAVDAAAYADRPVGRLSGGEQQRLLLAHALAGGPELLLMDEPLSHLDLRNQVAIVQLIGRIVRERGLTVLLIAHDVNPLLPYIDQVVYIANGRTAVGSPSQVINSATLSTIYSAPIDVLTDRHGRIFVTGLEEESMHPHA